MLPAPEDPKSARTKPMVFWANCVDCPERWSDADREASKSARTKPMVFWANCVDCPEARRGQLTRDERQNKAKSPDGEDRKSMRAHGRSSPDHCAVFRKYGQGQDLVAQLRS